MKIKLGKEDWEAAKKSATQMVKEGLQIQTHGQLLYDEAERQLRVFEQEKDK